MNTDITLAYYMTDDKLSTLTDRRTLTDAKTDSYTDTATINVNAAVPILQSLRWYQSWSA